MSLEDTAPTRAEIEDIIKRFPGPSQVEQKKNAVRNFLNARKLHPKVVERILTDMESYEYGPSKRYTIKKPK